jgi:Mg2+ and Co2+ transporter CorA
MATTQGETRSRSLAQPRDLLEATYWLPGQEPTPLDLEATDFGGGIAWFDLRSDGDPEALFDYLAPRCRGLTLEMLSDLLEPDRRPQGERWDDGVLRLASTFAVYPTKTKNGRGDWSCPVPSADLIYQPVELVSNGDWLLTCWHLSEVYCGYDRLGEPRPSRAHREICRGVDKRWRGRASETAADLGVLVMHELALTYAPAHRQLYSALEEWELSLYGDVKGDLTKLQADPQTLRNLWSARARLLDWLNPLNIPGLKEDLDKAWLPATDHEEVKKVDERVDKALAGLKTLGENLRSSFHSLQLLNAEGQRDRNERRQRRIERMAAIFLIPSLVVGFYGANTWVPGQQAHWGFWVMLVAILFLTWLGWSLINSLHNRDDLALPKLSLLGRSVNGDHAGAEESSLREIRSEANVDRAED